MKLGYDMEPEQDGRKSLYSDEQIRLLDELEAHIQATGSKEGFPAARIESELTPEEFNSNSEETNSNGELVHRVSEQIEIDSTDDEEIYVDTNPLEDIKEQQLASVDRAAQYSAAQNLAAFNYLTVDYMKHRDFTVPGLSEEVHQSEQAVKQSFDSMTEKPTQTTKKLLNKLRQRRNRQNGSLRA